MFGAFKKSVPQISIFHNTSSHPSNAALSLLRAAVSAPYPPGKPGASRLEFGLEVVEDQPPTADQIRTILSYLPATAKSHGESIHPAHLLSAHPTVHTRPTSAEGVAKLAKENMNALKWPIVVDWDHGRAAVGDADGVKSILEELRKRRDGEMSDEPDHKPKGWFS